jgi:26S proteasome regulatory subunit N7
VSQIINNSEVLFMIRENKDLEAFLTAYYKCHYKDFFVSFCTCQLTAVNIIKMVDEDKNIAIHKKYIIKEMRVMIYSLFLESYKTVTLDHMAADFGVSISFLDK